MTKIQEKKMDSLLDLTIKSKREYENCESWKLIKKYKLRKEWKKSFSAFKSVVIG